MLINSKTAIPFDTINVLNGNITFVINTSSITLQPGIYLIEYNVTTQASATATTPPTVGLKISGVESIPSRTGGSNLTNIETLSGGAIINIIVVSILELINANGVAGPFNIINSIGLSNVVPSANIRITQLN